LKDAVAAENAPIVQAVSSHLREPCARLEVEI
jgi:hypothetical protein